MIEASELRIGNYVMPTFNGITEPKPYRVTGMFIRQVDALENSIADNYNPIPLTPEILKMCGFEVKDDNPKQKGIYEGDVLVKIAGFEFTNSQKDGFVCWDIDEGKTVYKYLHQLQNLYFALTGKELKGDLTEMQNTNELLQHPQ